MMVTTANLPPAAAAQIARLLRYDPPRTWRGGNLALIESRDREVILSGPAETGKTWAACYKAHMMAREYAGANGALVRKVGATIAPTVLQTMRKIIGDFPVTWFGGEKSPERIIYPNGTQIWVGGMDNPAKVLSGERDWIQVCQAEELSLDDWEIMLTRTTGRGGVVPTPQLFGDCNPASPRHWIKRRETLRLLNSTHADNPSLYNDDGTLTEQGTRTMEALDSLTGLRYKRLRLGEWAAFEGMVFDNFRHDVHVMSRPREEFREFRLALDEGYTNPAVILVIGVDGDGRRHIMEEFYHRQKLQHEVVFAAVELAARYGVGRSSCDSAASGLIADLNDNGLAVRGAKGRVLERIAKIRDDLTVRGDGRPRLTVDPSCVNTINDFESYRYKNGEEHPVKEDDHAIDALGYDDVAYSPSGQSWLML